MADYDSNFETDTETERQREKRKDLAVGSQLPKKAKVAKDEAKQEFSRDEGKRRRMHFVALDAVSSHTFNRYDMMIELGDWFFAFCTRSILDIRYW